LQDEFGKEFIELTNLLVADLDKTFESIKRDFKIVGTIELPASKFSSNKISSEVKNQNLHLEKSKKNYKNFISSIFDRKEYYEDLQWFTCLLISNSFNITKYGE